MSADLGKLQKSYEIAARALKSANTRLKNARDQQTKAQEEYGEAKLALETGTRLILGKE